MRQERTVQATLFEVFAQHEIGCELKAMSQWLDGQRALISVVAEDLRRRGLPAESVLRCALLKQQRQLSCQELAFHLEDLSRVPKRNGIRGCLAPAGAAIPPRARRTLNSVKPGGFSPMPRQDPLTFALARRAPRTWSVTRAQADGQGMPAAAAAAPAAQLHLKIGEPHRAGPTVGEADVVDHRPMPAAPAYRFDNVPGPQILQPKGIARRHRVHRRSCVFIFCSI